MDTLRRKALIALGSNVASRHGDAAETLRRAMRDLRVLFFGISESRLYRTPAFPPGAGPDYVNAAISAETDLEPEAVLAALHRIEAAFDRERGARWASRTLDLDLIAMDDLIRPDREGLAQWIALAPERQAVEAPDRLILPHPRLQDRSFVLVPLADVAPDWRHPLSGLSVREMLAVRPAAERAAVVAL